MGGSSKSVTVGYKYYLGMHMVFCHGPIDKIIRIDFDDKTAWTGNAAGGQITISAENLFGGQKREGGVSGAVDIDMGGDTQTPNSYLVSKLGSMVPGFRGVVSAVFRQVYLGMNPYLKRPSFWGQRILVRQNGIAQWYIAKAAIGQDMNPAHIIRECLTDPDWGMGYPEADVDDTAFQAAADQMYSEGMGMSILWDRSVTLEEFIQEVLKHIDGSLFVDRTSGKFVLKLARGGYDVNSLLVLDESSVDKISDFKRNTIGELINSVTVVYWDASTGKNNSVTVQDIALAAQQQSVVSTTKQFPGFTNGTIATKVAARSLKALSVPLASGTIYANRKAASLNVGDVFVLSWPRYGISQLVMRVANVELGALDSNVVKISAVEDVFALSSAIYAPPPPSGWTDPNNDPAPCPYHCVIEAPFWELCQRMGETDARSIPTTAGFVVATGVRPTSDAGNAQLITNPTNTAYEEAGTVDFCPTAVLTAAITPNQTVIPISGGIDLDIVKINTYAIIDNELVVVTAISSSSMTVGRGVLDTVPVVHALGARVFFPDVYFETDTVEYATGETARIKLLPTTAKGTLAEGSAPVQTVTIQARSSRPYPPQQLRINTQAYPDTVRGDQNITVAWVHRDRLQQTATLVDTEAASIGPEANTTYTCRLLTQGGSVIATHAGLTGVVTDTFTLVEMGSNYGRLRIQLWAVRDGIQSLQMHDWEFTRSGYGTGYGYSYGGA
ncbi:virion structural protein [Xanthomonas phage vB_Xar_IVIA-DoCa3]|uniref:Virion structural protein n=1 Tax=Xanthomonas phage vB_Xar_IVIA-DoCa3 TaxID=2968248 RepID=A0A976XGG6_9CAUD|nr:virion structural protein [Xanthomonas phage vB_Xar_IVIA-DoCa3]UUW40262.1 virion structural protein [Xanthomonas phage vB_Xar_IVIA-DoCa3]